MRQAGQPTKLTPELQKRICDLVKQGSIPPYRAACICGVSHQTHYNWMQRGEDGDKGYVEYFEAIKVAEAEAEKVLVDVIREAAIGVEVFKEKTTISPQGTTTTEEVSTKMHWQAAAWLLERRHPERWKNKDLSAEEALQVLAKALASGDEDIARQLRTAVAEAAKQPSV